MKVLKMGKGRLEVKNEGKKAKVNIYGYIVSDEWEKLEASDVIPEEIQEFLSVIGDMDVDIHINSGGGTIYSGMAIYNMLKRHKGHKTVYIDGIAGSIASVIAMAGDKIICPSNSYFMIHKAWIQFVGNSDEFREKADFLDVMDEGLLNAYKEKLNAGVEIETIKDMMAKETWLTGIEAQKYFDIELSEAVNIAASFDKEYCDEHKVPQELKALIEDDPKAKVIEEEKAKLEIEKAKTLLMI
jgi:ATP-dependent protease ClpP protease subunit